MLSIGDVMKNSGKIDCVESSEVASALTSTDWYEGYFADADESKIL